MKLISALGNACDSRAALLGAGTTNVTCSATRSSAKTGTPILAAQDPSTLTQTMVGSGLEGVAFGVLVSTVEVTKAVVGRVNPTDAFAVRIASASGSAIASADTKTADTATTGQVTVLTSSSGEDYTITESATSGLLSDYTGVGPAPGTAPPTPACPPAKPVRQRRSPSASAISSTARSPIPPNRRS